MKLIVGLGNLGDKYKATRHNVGFMVVDALASQIQNSNNKSQNDSIEFKNSKKLKSNVCSLKSRGLILAKPQTFMNETGIVVASLVNFYKINLHDLFVIHDDLDITLGEYKIQLSKGPKDHNGLNSIYEKLGTKDFWHVRVGVDGREKMKSGKWKVESCTKGEDYVLRNFSEEEQIIITKVVEELAGKLINDLGLNI